MAPVVSALSLPSLSRFATSTDKATIGNADIVKCTMPELLENVPVDQFLSDLNFHCGSKAVREALAAAMKNLFGNLNMRQALRRYETKDEAGEAFRKVGICDELKGLSSKLEKLELVRLNKVVPEPRAERNILVPRLGKDVIWIKGGKASFADVVTQYKLYQCKHCTTDEALTINLKKELDKCGLLKGPRRPPRFRAGHIVMRALLQQWNNNDCTWAVAESRYASNPTQYSDSRATKRAFDSFPTNLLDAPYKFDDVPYVAVTCDRSTKRWTVNRKELGGMNLTKELRFVISTNTDNIQVSLGDGKPVQLPVVEGKVDMGALTSGDRKRYLAFLNQVVDGVVVEFLVTGR
jgi:hypothetical protein